MKKNNFLNGYSKALNLFGTQKNTRAADRMNRSDRDSLRKDWENVGYSIQSSIRQYEKRN